MRSNNNTRYKYEKIYNNPLFALAVVAAVVILIVVIARASGGNLRSNYFSQGVYINGKDMSEYTRTEGENILRSWADSVLTQRYTFYYTDKTTQQTHTWEFTPSQVDAKMNVEDVLAKSWALGHSGSKNDRQKAQQDLRQHEQNFTVELTYNESKFKAFVDSIYYDPNIYIEAIDAKITLGKDEPEILAPSSDGRELDREAFEKMLIILMNNYYSTTLYELPVTVMSPAVSSDTAEDGLQLIVEYSTDLSESSSDRCSNVRLALSRFNGYPVEPGETVSFNAVVGPRTLLQGYKEATVYYGDTVTTGVGGGVCQASSTLYGAVLKAGMDIVERDHHSLVVGYCESSMDAAVSDTQDFVFTNNTDYAIYIYTDVVTKSKATVRIYGNKPEYKIELVSTITQNDIKNSAMDVRVDTTGEIAQYKSDMILVKKGKYGRKSKLERLYYDRTNGALVKKELISEDYYVGERDIYYTGVLDDPF